MKDIIGSALRKTKSSALNKARGQLSSNLRGVLDKYKLPWGASLSSFIPGLGESTGWENNPLVESAFRVYFSAFPDLEIGYIKGASLQMPTINYGTQKIQGLQKYFPEGVSFGSVSITFNEDSYGSILALYNEWTTKVFDRVAGVYGLPAEYKQTVVIQLIKHDGTPVVTLNHFNCSPISLSGYSMSNAGASAITPTMTFNTEDILIVGSDGEDTSGGFSIKDIMSGAPEAIYKAVGNKVLDKIGRRSSILKGRI